jgi:elongation factor Ts
MTMTISPASIRALREKTGAGMSDCKNALVENNGDVESAIDWLRKKGMAAAAKKSGRVTAEGLIAVCSQANQAIVVEVNSETDFVAMNPNFQDFANMIAQTAFEAKGSLQDLMNVQAKGQNMTVQDALSQLIGSIGENIQIRRLHHLDVEQGVVASYVHSSVAPNLGKIGVLVALESPSSKTDALLEAGKKIAMHITASSPIALSKSDIGADLMEREKAILMEKAQASGKSEAIIEKMVESGITKFFQESALLDQAFVMDNKITVAQYVKQLESEVGSAVTLKGYVRFALGDGVEKVVSDFAAQVKAQASGQR